MTIPFKLVSSDSHIVEPPDLWTERIDPKYRHKAPTIVSGAKSDYFVCEGLPVPRAGIGFTSAALTKAEELKHQERWENIYRGAWDPRARLSDMERDSVEAEVLYPTFGLFMYHLEDLGFQGACFRAYNDWMAEFCSALPDRLFGVAMIANDSLDWAIDEMGRAKRMGLRAALISQTAGSSDSYSNSKYDSLWSQAQDLELPISLHLAADKSSFNFTNNILVDLSLGFTPVMYSVALMIFTGVFDRHPRLKVATVENEAGWAAIMIERMDYRYERDRFWAKQANGITSGRLPSQQFREHVRCSFMRDLTAVRARQYIGLDNLMWGSDFPHIDSTWPHSADVLGKHFVDVPVEHQVKIGRGNCIDLYDLPLDPRG